jgi:hypothetical protein
MASILWPAVQRGGSRRLRMSVAPVTSISERFATLTDPRRDHLKEHGLLEIVTM